MDVSWMHLTRSHAASLPETLPSMPNEIIDMILMEACSLDSQSLHLPLTKIYTDTFVQLCEIDYPTLLCAALVNRQFSELSRRHVWRHLTIKTPWPMERSQGCLSMFRFVKTMKIQSKASSRVDHQKTVEVVDYISQFLRQHGSQFSLESFQ